ncbi:MAG TPA: cob(I)yrinic acid a,c-diamide adenosyltransferase, partial [Usitatibacter sp.]|nr:cob(I)yrinic acid a,c-diamide adenosyltransferase [Usitatibacter sp.]
MGKRLTKIYTRTGDDGTTGLGDGTRVAKDGLRIAAIGAVDELNSFIGRVLAQEIPPAVRTCLENVQHDLFDLGAELCLPGVSKLGDAHVARLERELDAFNRDLPGLKEFILPGGSLAGADAHIARTVCRNAERIVVALCKAEPGGDAAR